MPEGERKPSPQRLESIKPAAAPLAQPSRHRRRWPFAGLGVVLLLAAAGAYYWFSGSEEPVHYVTAPVSRGDIARSIVASGTVNPVTTVQVGSYVSGVIQAVNCDFNTAVKAGQLCARIDPRPFQSAVDQAAANLASAKAQLGKDQAALAYAKSAAQRNAALVKRGIVSQDIADSSKAAHDQALAEVALDQATIVQRQAALDAAKINLDYTSIIAPVDGTVVSRNVTVGQTVAATLQSPTLFLIASDLTKMQVDANVSESDIGGVKEGNRATFTVQGFPNATFKGKVAQVRQAPITLQNVVTYDVVIQFDNPDLLLKPGMTATAHIFTAERSNVVRVPDQALHYVPAALQAETASASTGGPQGRAARASAGSRVFVMTDHGPQPVQIQVGLDDDANAEVLSGDIKEGDKVVVSETRKSQGRGASSGGGRGSQPRLPRF
jgi:HlyD family secretion protein